MKPTQAVIKLSQELWELGVIKNIVKGEWLLHSINGQVSLFMEPNTICSWGYMKKHNQIPIWTDPDDCIEWLRGEGWRKISIYKEIFGFSKKNFTLNIGKRKIVISTEAPALIEALLKAMVEVAK